MAFWPQRSHNPRTIETSQKQQGKRREARQLLARVYDWSTEGFDTADLHDAEVLLEELGT
jgi:hypothetical protein